MGWRWPAGALRALEFGAVVEMLAGLTAFTPSRELAEASQPSGDAVMVGLLQDQTDEAARLLDDQAQASIGGARDVRAALGRAERGGARGLSAPRLSSWRGRHLGEVRDQLDDAPALRERIERSVDESGEVL